MEQEKQPYNIIEFNGIKEGMRVCYHYPRKVEYLREERNELLKATDYYLLLDIVIDENKLNAVKIYRQVFRDFMNKLLNEEIECKMFDEEFDKKYFPKLILDGAET